MKTTNVEQLDVLREVLRSGADTKRAVDARLRAFDRIPFVSDAVRNSHLQLMPDDPVPEKIDPVLIRKSSPDNCLLSAPLRVGEVVYFNLLKETTEINIDHRSDHFVGLFILEGVRQIGMALSHLLAEIPLDTRMSLQEFSLYFYNYIEMDYPIVARGVATLTLDPDLRRDQTAFIDVRQNGRTCLAGTSSGRLFDTEERYQRIRSKTRVMNERYADEFASSLRGNADKEGEAQ